jgi:DNA-directed RNA polymerase specialized sigma24 family protein
MSKPTRTDKERFEALYRGTYSDLLAYLVRRTESSEDAADALAEAYLVAWEKLDAIPAGDGARLWMFGVARNLQLKTTESAESATRSWNALPVSSVPQSRPPARRSATTYTSPSRRFLTRTARSSL